VLAGAPEVPPGIAVPLKLSEYQYYAHKFERLEITVWHVSGRPVANPVEDHVPPDILWLFRRSWKDTFGPFVSSASSAMGNAMETGTKGYARVVTTLIDNCFESGGADIRYSSIHDIDNPVLFEQYKIVTPIR